MANLIMCALFSFSALLQFNDPDPVGWIAIYATAAATCAWLSMTRGRYTATWMVPTLVAALAFVWAGLIAVRAPAHVGIARLFEAWEMKNQAIERDREMYGLLIVGIWMMIVAGVNARRGQRSRRLV